MNAASHPASTPPPNSAARASEKGVVVGDPRDVVRHGERLLFAHLREQTNSGIDRPLRAVDRVR